MYQNWIRCCCLWVHNTHLQDCILHVDDRQNCIVLGDLLGSTHHAEPVDLLPNSNQTASSAKLSTQGRHFTTSGPSWLSCSLLKESFLLQTITINNLTHKLSIEAYLESVWTSISGGPVKRSPRLHIQQLQQQKQKRSRQRWSQHANCSETTSLSL